MSRASLFSLAGFQVTFNGRFWVTTEADPDVSRPRLIREARFLEAGRREIALRRGRHLELGVSQTVIVWKAGLGQA